MKKIHHDKSIRSNPCFLFPLGLCGGHCTVFNLYRSKPYLETLFEVCTLPKEWVYKALGEPAWRHAKHEDLALTHFGFLSFLLGLESSLSLSLSLSSSFPPLLGALFNEACQGFIIECLQRRLVRRKKVRGMKKNEEKLSTAFVMEDSHDCWLSFSSNFFLLFSLHDCWLSFSSNFFLLLSFELLWGATTTVHKAASLRFYELSSVWKTSPLG